MSIKELYGEKRAEQRAEIEKKLTKFGFDFIRGEYAASIFLFMVSIAVCVVLSFIPLRLYRLVEAEEARELKIRTEINGLRKIMLYERNITVSSEPVERAREVAAAIAVIQNKYIVAVLEDKETVSHIDRELRHANYLLNDFECTAWINMRERETLKRVFASGDFYWAGYADNTLKTQSQRLISVFFILYDGGYPIQIIEYKYDTAQNILRSRKDWG